MKNEELLQLIIAANQKDQKSQTQLINLFWETVFSFIMKKVQDINTTDELTVIVFTKVLSKLNLYDPDFQFKTWVLTIAQNTIIDYWRKNNTEKEYTTDQWQDMKNQFAQSPEELMISVEEQQKIQNIISGMDSRYQKIIQLRFFEEKSIKEISEELNITVANTKVCIMRAKKILVELLKDYNLNND
ncbi:RNA polymerase sigma factor [Amniculibacterium aquaticum]|uniref:RNA polymerase sigma factor n=1 Tax=Amniculibacterium aquaticum TaxID=2479858 RepID=UPI000F5AE935|nr:sigma-70 family RNA polymerase sigma factor [Amniculibacterium aquaticum]